jgi:hypothetical protein
MLAAKSGESSRIWMSGSGGCSGPRPGRWAMTASGWWLGPPGSRGQGVPGVDELGSGAEPLGRARAPGGGRKCAADVDLRLRSALLALG